MRFFFLEGLKPNLCIYKTPSVGVDFSSCCSLVERLTAGCDEVGTVTLSVGLNNV